MKRFASVYPAFLFITACGSPTVSDGRHTQEVAASSPVVSDGRHAQEVAAAISDLNNDNLQSCLNIMGRAPLTSSDVVGPASALCKRKGGFKDVTDISQRNEGVRSFVTIRFKQGTGIELLFEGGMLVLANSGFDFPHPPATS